MRYRSTDNFYVNIFMDSLEKLCRFEKQGHFVCKDDRLIYQPFQILFTYLIYSILLKLIEFLDNICHNYEKFPNPCIDSFLDSGVKSSLRAFQEISFNGFEQFTFSQKASS